MFHVDHTDMDIVVMPVEQLRTLLVETWATALKHNAPPAPATPDAEPNGDFKWLKALFPGIPESTLRQWDAAGKIPGSSKFGKRKIYHKETVSKWLRSQTRQPTPDATQLVQAADEQISRQLAKKGGVPA